MRLIIGRRNYFINEQFISGDDSPEYIKERIIKLFGISFNEEDSRQTENIEFPNHTIVTFSPFVIDCFIKLCRIEGEEHPISYAFFHYIHNERENDYRIVDFMEKSRLIHFSLGELYTDLTLSAAIKDKLE